MSKLISKRLNKNIATKDRTNLVETFAVIGVLAEAVYKTIVYTHSLISRLGPGTKLVLKSGVERINI